MKQIFKKDYKTWQTPVIICCMMVLILLLILEENYRVSILYLLLFLPILFNFLRKYTITEGHVLRGNGEIPIENMLKIVYEPHQVTHGFIHIPNWVTIYYVETRNGKTKVRRFYPKDAEGFIQALTSINRHIEVI